MTTPPDTPKPPAERVIDVCDECGHLEHARSCSRYILAPSPQESHKLAEELERLIHDYDHPETHSDKTAMDLADAVYRHSDAIISALRSTAASPPTLYDWLRAHSYLIDAHTVYFGAGITQTKPEATDAAIVKAASYGHEPVDLTAAAQMSDVRDAARYRWLRENIDYIIDDGDGVQGAAFGCQGISLERMQSASDAELLDDVCDYCIRAAIAASGGAQGDGNG